MADHDAFGRDTREDPLAAMGWTGSETSARTAPAETATTSTGTPGRAQARPREPVAPALHTDPTGHTSPHLARAVVKAFVLVLFVAAAAVFVAAFAVPRVDEAIDDPATTVALPGAGAGGTRAERPSGLARRSLLRRANFAAAVRSLRARGGGRVRFLRVEAARIDVQIVAGGDTLRSLQHRWDTGTQLVSSATVPGIAGLASIPWSAVDTAAPERLVRSVTAQLERPASAFGYAVLQDVAGLRWAAFGKDGTNFVAGPTGRRARRPGS